MNARQTRAIGEPAPRASVANPPAAILITGVVPAARLRAIGSLIGFKPRTQRWIVITSGLLAHQANAGTPPAGIEFAGLPPGCLCCTGLLPFKVGLTRLLRSLSNWAPTHLIIDAGTESHAASVRTQLVKPDFARLLRLKSVVAAIDAPLMGSAPSALRQALGSLCANADLVICGTSAASDSSDICARFRTEFGIAALFVDAADPACAVHAGLTAGSAGA